MALWAQADFSARPCQYSAAFAKAEVPGTECSNEWCEPVSDEDYNKLKEHPSREQKKTARPGE